MTPTATVTPRRQPATGGYLNSGLDDLATIVGFTATVALAAHYGNSNLYVPATVDEGQPLARRIGLQAARRLVQEWAGEQITIPSLAIVAEVERRAKAMALLDRGVSPLIVARSLDLSRRRVEQIRAENRQ